MSTFNAIGVAGTGVTVYRKWLDAVSDNIANIEQRQPDLREGLPGAVRGRPGGARTATAPQVGGVAFGSAEGILTYDPDNPLADSKGYVRRPDIDLGSQMAQMMMAQRAYQANLAVVDRAKESYTAAINLGK